MVLIKTEGDKHLDTSLAEIGGKGLFIKELEHAIAEGRADIAVHSMKDVTIDIPDGFTLPVIMHREDPRDVFISNNYTSISALPAGARVGTSSLRRKSQLSSIRSDLSLLDLRGNLGTRLNRLDHDEYDAIILAAAGIKRMGLSHRINQYLEPEIILPAVGQGALGIETRDDDSEVNEVISGLNDNTTATLINAERVFCRHLGGSCQLPIAAYAEKINDQIYLRGMVGSLDGSEIIKDGVSGPLNESEALGIALADQLLEQGADRILEKLLDA